MLFLLQVGGWGLYFFQLGLLQQVFLLVLLPEVSDTLKLKFVARLKGFKCISLLWSWDLMQGWLHYPALTEWFQRCQLLNHRPL